MAFTIVAFAVVGAAPVLLALLSCWAMRGRAAGDPVPIQWDADGKGVGFASRRVFLFFTPSLALLTLLPLAIANALTDANLRFAIATAAFIAAHLIHLWRFTRASRGARAAPAAWAGSKAAPGEPPPLRPKMARPIMQRRIDTPPIHG